MPNATSTLSEMMHKMVTEGDEISKFMVLDLKSVVRNLIDAKASLLNTQTWKLLYDLSYYSGSGMVEVMNRMDVVVTGGEGGREAFGVRKCDSFWRRFFASADSDPSKLHAGVEDKGEARR